MRHDKRRLPLVTALRVARRRRGMYQYQAARQFAVSEVSWSRYETGMLPFPDDLRVRVALAWFAPELLRDHPVVAAWLSMGDSGPRDPAPARSAA